MDYKAIMEIMEQEQENPADGKRGNTECLFCAG